MSPNPPNHREDKGFDSLAALEAALQLKRTQTSWYNFNCLMFATFGAVGCMDPQGGTAESRQKSDTARRKVHSLLMQQPMPSSPEQLLPGHSLKDAWYRSMTPSDATTIFEVTQLNCSCCCCC